MIESLGYFKDHGLILEILSFFFIVMGFLVYYYPHLSPLWFNGLFRPNRRQLSHSKIKFHIVHGDDIKYSLFKFKHGLKYLELDKRLHCWLLDTRYRDIYRRNLLGVPFLFHIISVYRKVMLSNIEDTVTNTIEVSDYDLLEGVTGVFGMEREHIRLEFRIVPFHYCAIYDDSVIKLMMNSIKRWSRASREWHNLRLTQEIVDGLGVLEIRYKDNLIHKEYGVINIKAFDEDDNVIEVAPEIIT